MALEKLWDAFERFKTLQGPDKKSGIENLLAAIGSAEFAARVNAEMVALTKIGNEFQIRHFEADRHPLPRGTVDYLYGRMSALLAYLRTLSA